MTDDSRVSPLLYNYNYYHKAVRFYIFKQLFFNKLLLSTRLL